MICPHTPWLSKPLCCRYVFAGFKTLRLPVRVGDVVTDATWRWALGLFRQDEYEVLGAWPPQSTHEQVARDLHARGVERIVAVHGRTDCRSSFPGAVIWPPAVAPEEAGSTAALHPFGRRRRAVLQSAVATAAQIQSRIARAIKRRAPFSDEAAAAAFLTEMLQKADRRFFNA
ncbi:hypothetical protein [Roseateles sp.]|uniref:hypothetical protein n=1 Tax=Roseateles sp. TaxID=1971397 RepID=UPI0025E6308C|nr:hypothetical protein [Roseateles sp.]MBV8035527.1 hypothetical protein [Roseateles sp.]